MKTNLKLSREDKEVAAPAAAASTASDVTKLSFCTKAAVAAAAAAVADETKDEFCPREQRLEVMD